MTKRTFLPYAALAMALLLSAMAFGGAADAAAKAIGKNLVVTKSIKNGAVTGPKLAAGAVDGSKLAGDSVDGSKVKNGSLTAADLAPGTLPTIPAPTNGKAAVFASTLLTNAGLGAQQVFSPFGPAAGTASAFGALAPTALTVADLHVLTNFQSGLNSLQVALVTAPDFSSIPNGTTTVATCNVPTGSSSCSSTQTGTIPAGNVFWMVSTNGSGGTSSTFVAASYTMKVQ
jgi:hypothetical protein